MRSVSDPPSKAARAGAAWLDGLAAAAIEGVPPSRSEALALLGGEGELLDLVAAAARVRRRFRGERVRLNFLINMKSGACPEDCAYCSQRRGSEADVLKYSWLKPEELAELADAAAAGGARRVCLVAAGRCPGERDLGRVEAGIGAIRERQPELEICTCLGLIEAEAAERLREAGAVAYNHNLNTSEAHYGEVCSTHAYADRVATVRCAEGAGLSACSGAIFGMGEGDEDVVDVAFSLRELEPASVPVNFLIPFEGTPLAGEWRLTPRRCLRILALFRLVLGDVELRLGGGRELHLRSLQPLALQIADSIFIGDYLTSEGEAAAADLAMIEDAGLVVDGLRSAAPRGERRGRVAPRRRGAGTELAPNV
jgi:biotin synthase